MKKLFLKLLLYIFDFIGLIIIPMNALYYKIQSKLLKLNNIFSENHNIPIEYNGVVMKEIVNRRVSRSPLNNYTSQYIELLEDDVGYLISLNIPLNKGVGINPYLIKEKVINKFKHDSWIKNIS